jgi:large exoprotein involved in heme utilization and adhesion
MPCFGNLKATNIKVALEGYNVISNLFYQFYAVYDQLSIFNQ